MIANRGKRTTLLQVRLTDEEYSSLGMRARREGMPTSTFVRVRMLEYCRKENKKDEDL